MSTSQFWIPRLLCLQCFPQIISLSCSPGIFLGSVFVDTAQGLEKAKSLNETCHHFHNLTVQYLCVQSILHRPERTMSSITHRLSNNAPLLRRDVKHCCYLQASVKGGFANTCVSEPVSVGSLGCFAPWGKEPLEESGRGRSNTN